jgi:hypothetical protein
MPQPGDPMPASGDDGPAPARAVGCSEWYRAALHGSRAKAPGEGPRAHPPRVASGDGGLFASRSGKPRP